MTEFNIFRPLTEDEKNEIIPLGRTKDLMNKFLAELAKVSAKYQKNLKPFDSYSAKLDFEEGIQKKMHEISAAIDKSTVEKFTFGDLEHYGEPDRFEFIDKVDQALIRLVAGMKQEVVIGKKYKFKCKQRGNIVTLVVKNEQIDDFEKWLSDTYTNKKGLDKKQEKDDTVVPSKNKKK